MKTSTKTINSKYEEQTTEMKKLWNEDDETDATCEKVLRADRLRLSEHLCGGAGGESEEEEKD